ncbi:hypothetical protein DFQ01_103248 [Paenibacillus cellulosilyticus]|uniref:WYL domain-containing protein n=1 Tax=Paenibacillus cellulosilyticus TaxID=375489 RepID=A0A2V2YY32_9BACL|nr:hypothetical protein DFQ01_103248 [Paenibacillus cellulosilyticus]
MQKYVGKLVQLIYIDRKRQVSIRNVRVLSVQGSRLKAYCMTARAPRVFNIDSIVDVELIRSVG